MADKNDKGLDFDSFDFESLDPTKNKKGSKNSVAAQPKTDETPKEPQNDTPSEISEPIIFDDNLPCADILNKAIYSGDGITEHTIVNKTGRILTGPTGKRHNPTGYIAVKLSDIQAYVQKVKKFKNEFDSKLEDFTKKLDDSANKQSELEKELSETESKNKPDENLKKEFLELKQKHYDLDQEYNTLAGQKEILEEKISVSDKENEKKLDSLKNEIYNNLQEQGYDVAEDGRIIPPSADEKDKRIAELETELEILKSQYNDLNQTPEAPVKDGNVYLHMELKLSDKIKMTDYKGAPTRRVERGEPRGLLAFVENEIDYDSIEEVFVVFDVDLKNKNSGKSRPMTLKAELKNGTPCQVKTEQGHVLYPVPGDEISVRAHLFYKLKENK